MTWTTPGQWVSTGSDRTPPVSTLVGGDIIHVSGSDYEELGYSSSDDIDGDITRRVIVTIPNLISLGSKQVTYDSFDIRGNTTISTRDINIVAASGNYTIWQDKTLASSDWVDKTKSIPVMLGA